ncbi:hypothetical protein [Bosea sp. 117]|uniref:hypothetical protein n=1 Tax=Bosea sp. 117 TaxID=1125973 RepID=UPI0012DF276E|nr:hypothetical protein [Bosea sp. 117]
MDDTPMFEMSGILVRGVARATSYNVQRCPKRRHPRLYFGHSGTFAIPAAGMPPRESRPSGAITDRHAPAGRLFVRCENAHSPAVAMVYSAA